MGKISVKVPHQRSPHAVKFEDRSNEETERQQRCARSKAWNLAKNMYKLKENDKATVCSPAEERVLQVASTEEPEERKFVVDSGASMHMVSKKDLNSAELETMRTSRSPTTVMTANGEVRTCEEATVYVKQLDLLVTVMLLEETPAVLSLGKLCEDHGYTYQRSKTTSHQKMARKMMATYPTMHHLWFLVYRRVLRPLHFHLLLHHLHHRIPLFDANRYTENPVQETSGSTSQEPAA